MFRICFQGLSYSSKNLFSKGTNSVNHWGNYNHGGFCIPEKWFERKGILLWGEEGERKQSGTQPRFVGRGPRMRCETAGFILRVAESWAPAARSESISTRWKEKPWVRRESPTWLTDGQQRCCCCWPLLLFFPCNLTRDRLSTHASPCLP